MDLGGRSPFPPLVGKPESMHQDPLVFPSPPMSHEVSLKKHTASRGDKRLRILVVFESLDPAIPESNTALFSPQSGYKSQHFPVCY